MLSFAEAPKCKIQDAHKVTLYHCDNTALYSYSSFKKLFFVLCMHHFLTGIFSFARFSLLLAEKIFPIHSLLEKVLFQQEIPS